MSKRAAAKRAEEVEDEFAVTPLFESSTDIAYIVVERDEPEEGYIGRLRPTATEKDIAKKFGGGSYSLSARNSGGKPVKGGHRSINIGGDPIFQSRAAELRWKRQQGLLEQETPGKPAAAGDKPIGIIELMMLLDKQGEKARLEMREFSSAREREAQLAHERQLELLRTDASRREVELKAERDRLEADSREREARREREAKEERERNRDHMQVMLQIATAKRSSSEGGLEALLKGVELAREMGGGEEQDPAMAILNNLPAIIGHLRGGEAPAVPALAAAPPAGKRAGKSSATPETERNGIPRVTLQGPLATKVDAVARQLKAAGLDPAKAFEQMLDNVIAQQAAAQATPATAAPPGPPPGPARRSRKKPVARRSATR